MSDTKKQIDPIPEEFDSYEEAAEFWDTHEITDFEDQNSLRSKTNHYY